jgi:hypothetical protein
MDATTILIEAGIDDAIACEQGEDGVITIQDVLILSEDLNDLAPFHRVMQQLPQSSTSFHPTEIDALMGFTKPVAEIAIRTTAIDDLVLKITLTTAQSSTIQRHLLEAIALHFLQQRFIFRLL